MKALISLANNPDRLIRLLSHFADNGYEITSQCKANVLRQSIKGVLTIDLDESKEYALSDEQACEFLQIYLSANEPDLELISAILRSGGEICDSIKDADLIVCESSDLDRLREEYPRKLVVADGELHSLIKDCIIQANVLRAPVAPYLTPVPRLPENLKACWAKIRRRSISAINEGLDLFDEVVQADPTAGDPLLDQVEVIDGELIPGRRFRLNDTHTHPYSYYALLGILSRSPAGSRGEALRLGITRLINRGSSYEPLEIIVLPELRGFCNLETIKIHILEPDNSKLSTRLSDHWSELVSLMDLSLAASDGVTIQFDLLDAPKLSVLTLDGKSFKEIDGLSQCKSLSSIDISHTAIRDLAPLSGICKSLRSVDLTGTRITSLEAFSGCQEIKHLNIDNCKRLPSLRGLEEVMFTGDRLSVNDAGVENLQFLPLYKGDTLSLGYLPISSLDGIEKLSNLKSLNLFGLQNLKTIDCLLSLHSLEELSIDECDNLDDFAVLAGLPKLRRVSISGCNRLVSMPEQWPDSLRQLNLKDLATRRIGSLPSSYQDDLGLQTVHRLETVEDLRHSVKIQEIWLTVSQIPAMKDLTPLANYQDLWLNINMESKSSLPDEVVEMLSKLPFCRLRLDDYENIDLTNLARLGNLKALDLDVNYVWIRKDELRPILNMNALEYLQIPAGSLPEFGGCTFNTASKVAKVKMQLLVS